jgi:hypothetical protein
MVACSAADSESRQRSDLDARPYAAILAHVSEVGIAYLPPEGVRIRLSEIRPIEGMELVATGILQALAAEGYPTAVPGTPLCPDELRVSFGPAERTGHASFTIDAEFTFAWSDHIGDIVYHRYHVDCGPVSCAIAHRQLIAQEEVGVLSCDSAIGPRQQPD